ncbi:MAG TPA: PadR family transcriptional regulator [Gemmatimonadaceae bacterium]|nr:PadR family transcriptional regulator [Gemmatimonadaceae bacterium]
MAAPLGELEQVVLLALMRLGEDGFGVGVQHEIEGNTQRRVALGAIYTTLARLEQKGLIASRVGEPTARRGGRRKKLYRVLPKGKRALVTSIETLHALTRGLAPSLQIP